MALYQVTITGTAEVHRVYEVEADNPQEAGDKAWNSFYSFDEPEEYTIYPNEDDVIDEVTEIEERFSLNK